MAHVSRGMLLAGLVAGFALLTCTRPVAAQDKGEAVRITTVDGVTIHGMFFPSAKKDAPTIIFLHKIGEGEKGLQKSYYTIAESLQKNYAVMLFDFRGHGKSKDVNAAEFWKQPFNATHYGRYKPTVSNIEYKYFKPSYAPALVNDIASVKAFLDRRNDQRECNTSSTILIGAESGATLGAIWLNSQWSLVRMLGANPALMQPGQPSPNPEGKDVIACIWMSIDSSLGKGSPVSVTQTLATPVKVHGCATVFMYGGQNTQDSNRASALIKGLKRGDDKKYEFVAPYAIKGTKLRGISLAQGSIGLDTIISDYLGAVVDKKGGEWQKRDFTTTQYMWRMGGQLTPAKLISPTDDPNNLRFSTYEHFLGR